MNPPVLLYACVFAGAFLCVLALVPLFRALAWRLDVVDHPTDARKVHARAVPYLGGLPFFIAFLGLILGLEWFAPQYAQPDFYPMAVAGFLVVLLGIYDDVCDLSSKIKLPLELALCGTLFFWGFGSVIIAHPLGGVVHIGWLGMFVTAVWIAGIMNAINFTDGLDGLAAGLVCVCSLSIFAIAFQGGRVSSCIIMLFLAGVTLAFLCYNFNPASIFMGDAGALFLGFLLGASTVMEHQKGSAVVALTIPIMVMAVPLLDTVLSFLRRLQRARTGKFFQPDRDHLHHRMLDLGLTQRQVALSFYYISACMGVLAYVLSGVSDVYRFLALGVVLATVFFGVAALRHVETLVRETRQAHQSPDNTNQETPASDIPE